MCGGIGLECWLDIWKEMEMGKLVKERKKLVHDRKETCMWTWVRAVKDVLYVWKTEVSIDESKLPRLDPDTRSRQNARMENS